MIAKYKCLNCIINHASKLFEKTEKTLDISQEEIFNNYKKIISYLIEKAVWGKKPIEISLPLYEKMEEVFGKNDYFENEKIKANNIFLNMYDELIFMCENSEDKIHSALKLSAVGNYIDFGINNAFGELEWEIENLLKTKEFYLNDIELFKKDLEVAKTLLFIHDNAGEIVLDKILIQVIKNIFPNIKVYSAVRSQPIINDATLYDAESIKLNELSLVLESGSKYPGTLLSNVSGEFRNIFNEADVIISKGQGNYEGLVGTGKGIFFILMAKCDVVAESLNMKKGDIVLKKI
jgi:hypothetical protein